MSLVFSDTSNYKGIVQFYERECGFNRADVSGNTAKLKEFTADVNLALDDFLSVAIPASGTWQMDDTNHTAYPIITTNLVANQRDYSFTSDEQGNLLLDIYKVLVADSSGIFHEIDPVDVESESDTTGFTDGRNGTGTPTRYDKTANGIFLDPIPATSVTAGLKVYVNREGSYFTYTDTTKKPGVPGLFHKYFYLKPALDYARRNNLANFATIQAEVTKLEGNARLGIVGAIEEYFASRTRDERPRLAPAYQNNK